MWSWGWSLMKQAPLCCLIYPSAPCSSPHFCQPLAYPHLFSLDYGQKQPLEQEAEVGGRVGDGEKLSGASQCFGTK